MATLMDKARTAYLCTNSRHALVKTSKALSKALRRSTCRWIRMCVPAAPTERAMDWVSPGCPPTIAGAPPQEATGRPRGLKASGANVGPNLSGIARVAPCRHPHVPGNLRRLVATAALSLEPQLPSLGDGGSGVEATKSVEPNNDLEIVSDVVADAFPTDSGMAPQSPQPPSITPAFAPKPRTKRKNSASPIGTSTSPAADSDIGETVRVQRRRPSKTRKAMMDVGAAPTNLASSTTSVSSSYDTDADEELNGNGAVAAVQFSSKLPSGPRWSSIRQWVVFSDLHVRESSLATCLEVLKAVATEAHRRQAGVLFLGDFWDRRGALPVEPLNQVLQEMSSWRCPVLMLVGNHDQVDLGGRQHGLTPLELACPHVHVFDEPTRWHGALWLPYRRQTGLLEAAMKQAVQEATVETGATLADSLSRDPNQCQDGDPETVSTGALNAIFLHADIITARTNQWRQANEGLEPGAFPPHLPIYSGHYHLPHTVPGTSITYIGSPYQVSMNEASEAKRLLVLSAPSWRVLEEIPLNLGPRHVRLSGPSACDQLQQILMGVQTANGLQTGGSSREEDGDEDTAGTEGAGLAPQLPLLPAPRQGDRVKLWLSSTEARDERVVHAMAELERAGVSVEQVLQPEVRTARLVAAEGLAAEHLVDLYCSNIGVGEGRGGLSTAAAVAVRDAVVRARDAGSSHGGGPETNSGCVDLDLETVTLRGFGPFVEEQTYPLASRGVRVIVGSNLDDGGADSNGAGKTSLVTAPLWALTGEVLARTESGAGGGRVPVDSMRNDQCSSCAVTLRGRLGGQPFEVMREVKRGKTSSLSLRLGDEDLTMQDISGTADRIRRLFATELLRCSAFFGQNDITGLLEANDATLKQKLGLVVDLEIWEVARQLLVAPRKAALAAAAEEEGRTRVLEGQRVRRAEEVVELQSQEKEWAKEWERRLENMRGRMAERAEEVVTAAAHLAPMAAVAQGLISELRLVAAGLDEQQRRAKEELLGLATAAALPPPSASSSPPSSPAVVVQQEQKQEQQQEQQQQEQRQVVEEQEAALVLSEWQNEATRLQQLLEERRAAAALALGRLRQLEASLREYLEALATAAARSTMAGAGAAHYSSDPATAGAAAALMPYSPDAGRPVEHMAAALLQRRYAVGDQGYRWDDKRRSNGHMIGHTSSGLPSDRAKLPGPGDCLSGDESVGSKGAEVVAGVEAEMEAVGGVHPPANAILMVCDRCRQSISLEQYESNVHRLQGGIDEARRMYDDAALEEQEVQAAHAAVASRVALANETVLELQRRRIEAERRAAAEARAVALAMEREARAAEEAARRSREAAWRQAEVALRKLQAMVVSSSRNSSNLLASASDLERVVAEVQRAAAACVLHAATADGRKGPAGVKLDISSARCEAAVDATTALQRGDFAAASGGTTAAAAGRTPEAVLAAARAAAVAGREAVSAVASCLAGWRESEAALEAAEREVNPRSELRARAEHELGELDKQLEEAGKAAAAASAHLAALTDADRALGRGGLPSLLLEEVLAQLQSYAALYLNELCDGFVLELSATKPAAAWAGGRRGGSGGGGSAGGREKEEISKVIKVRHPADGSMCQRDVRQLSGGERRRVALALCLGFEQLVRQRRRLVCNVMVLDEVLQQLDNTGCERVARVLRDLPHAGVLLVGQSNSSVTANFERMDVVVKEQGTSRVKLGT